MKKNVEAVFIPQVKNSSSRWDVDDAILINPVEDKYPKTMGFVYSYYTG